jgi:Brp/Blh family beta-carotene 15,15'-monooxygenase
VARTARYAPPVVALVATAVLGPLGAVSPDLGLRVGTGVLVVGLLLGLPHGALDVDRLHRALLRTSPGHPHRRLVGLVAGYATVTGVVLALWWAAPLAVLLVLLGLTIAHFGTADLAVTRWAGALIPGPSWVGVLTLGGLPVVVPLALRPATTTPLLNDLSGGHAPTVHAIALAVLPLVAVATATVLVTALRRRDLPTAATVTALGLLVCLVPALPAFGVYFAAWHALRQTCTQLADTGAPALGVRRAGRVLARQAVLPTAGALTMICALLWAGGGTLTGASLALLLAITVPHTLTQWQVTRQRSTLAATAGSPVTTSQTTPRTTAALPVTDVVATPNAC